jgi:hypothetical protein
MERKDVIRSILQAVDEFNGRRLWKRFTNFDCFGVRIFGGEGEPESMIGIVMGAGGDEYGVSLFRGPQAAAALAVFFGEEGGDDLLEDLDMLGFSMDQFGNLSPEGQALLREAGRHPRYDEQTPGFLVKPPGQRPRVANESELALLLSVLRALMEADQKKLLEPTRLDSKAGICVLTIRGDPRAPQVAVTREKWQSPPPSRIIPLPSVGANLKGLGLLEETWLVGTPTLSTSIRGDDRGMQLLLVADEASEYVFEARPMFAGDLQEAVDAIVQVFRKGPHGRKGLPREIVCSNRKLHEAMTPILEPLGVRCTFETVIPKLREIAAGFLEYMEHGAPLREDEDQDVEVPAPDDLQGWKAVDQRLIRRFIERVRSGSRFPSSRAVKRYFDDDDLEHYLHEHEKQGVGGAYTAWCVADYRPSKTSKTYAEQMLAEGLPAPEAILLRARMEGYPSLYRIARHDPKAGTVDLEDVLLGGKVTVHDRLMSENIKDGIFFCTRVFAAGQFHFLEPVGPPLGAGMGMEAVKFLQQCEMEFTPEGLRRDAHKLGWLWQWVEDWQANWRPPLLRNTDGDDLLWHTASFSVTDPGATRQALLRRPDIEYDDQEDEFVWIKKSGQGAQMLGGPVTMGRMELVGDELVLTVNSAKRFATARQWLEKLPGVAFRSVKTRRWDEKEKDRPLDERMPGPEPVEMTPELTAAVQETLNKQYMNWIDMPLPVLGGRTPREACRTEAGRQQVTMLIRTAPDPSGPAPIRVPREAMMRELGLPTGPAAPISGQPVPPSRAPLRQEASESGVEPAHPAARGPQVPRNAPCPCGSGRKYKKCCGR